MITKPRVSQIKRARKKSIFLHEISSLVQKISLDEPQIAKVYVSRIELSSDAGILYIYFASYSSKEEFDKALGKLKLYKPSMRKFLAGALKLRYAPDLVFLFDEKKEKVRKIDDLLEKVHKELDKENKFSTNSSGSN